MGLETNKKNGGDIYVCITVHIYVCVWALKFDFLLNTCLCCCMFLINSLNASDCWSMYDMLNA